jgi:DNA-nicking Smr family endonuclease
MPRRTRSHKDSSRDAGSTAHPAKAKPFHTPFAALARSERARAAAEALPAAAASRAPAPPPAPTPVLDDAELLASALAGVTPLADARAPYRPPPPAPGPQRLSEDEEALLQLSEFVAGQGEFDIADSDEHVEGAIAGLDPRILRRLRKGEYAVAGHLDLHGLVRDEARAELTRFVERARLDGKRCVLVVHGRGLHSKDQVPVLKEAVVGWLGRSALRKQVLAFATARPYDGGAGALYVLLRR